MFHVNLKKPTLRLGKKNKANSWPRRQAKKGVMKECPLTGGEKPRRNEARV